MAIHLRAIWRNKVAMRKAPWYLSSTIGNSQGHRQEPILFSLSVPTWSTFPCCTGTAHGSPFAPCTVVNSPTLYLPSQWRTLYPLSCACILVPPLPFVSHLHWPLFLTWPFCLLVFSFSSRPLPTATFCVVIFFQHLSKPSAMRALLCPSLGTFSSFHVGGVAHNIIFWMFTQHSI